MKKRETLFPYFLNAYVWSKRYSTSSTRRLWWAWLIGLLSTLRTDILKASLWAKSRIDFFTDLHMLFWPAPDKHGTRKYFSKLHPWVQRQADLTLATYSNCSKSPLTYWYLLLVQHLRKFSCRPKTWEWLLTDKRRKWLPPQRQERSKIYHPCRRIIMAIRMTGTQPRVFSRKCQE